MSDSAEIVINLWAVYDATTGVIYSVAGRAYMMRGTDADKMRMLRELAVTDFPLATRQLLPDRFVIEFEGGRERRRVAPLSVMRDPNADLFEELIQRIERELPPRMEIREETPRPRPQALPEPLLSVRTVVHEDDEGNVRPIITDEDRAWFDAQVRR